MCNLFGTRERVWLEDDGLRFRWYTALWNVAHDTPTRNTTPMPTLTAAAAAVLHAGAPADGAGAVPRGRRSRRGRGLAGRCLLVPGDVLLGLGHHSGAGVAVRRPS